MLKKQMLSIGHGYRITSPEIPPDDTQHDHLLSETILLGDLYPNRLGGGLDPHILPVGGLTIKYLLLITADNNSTTPETINSKIFEQFSSV